MIESGLTYLKMNLKIESGYTNEDDDLNYLLSVSQYAIENYISDYFSGFTVLPLPLYHATILLATHYYLNPNIVSFAQGTEIPFSFRFLIDPYKKLTYTPDA